MNSWANFRWIEPRSIILPDIQLPIDYMGRIPEFYKDGRKEIIDELVFNYNAWNNKRVIPGTEVELIWNKELGLKHIKALPSGGLDLDERSGIFVEHNIGMESALITGAIAVAYLHEILNCNCL